MKSRILVGVVLVLLSLFVLSLLAQEEKTPVQKEKISAPQGEKPDSSLPSDRLEKISKQNELILANQKEIIRRLDNIEQGVREIKLRIQ